MLTLGAAGLLLQALDLHLQSGDLVLHRRDLGAALGDTFDGLLPAGHLVGDRGDVDLLPGQIHDPAVGGQTHVHRVQLGLSGGDLGGRSVHLGLRRRDLPGEFVDTPVTGEAQHIAPTVPAVGATGPLGHLPGHRQRRPVGAELLGGIHAHEAEPLIQAVLQPPGEGGVAVVESAGQLPGVTGDPGLPGLHTFEADADAGPHLVDRRPELRQCGLVDEQRRREPAEGQVEGLPPGLELGAHLDKLTDERQLIDRQTGGLRQCGTRGVQLPGDVVGALSRRLPLRLQLIPPATGDGRRGPGLRVVLTDTRLDLGIRQRGLPLRDQRGERLLIGHGSTQRDEVLLDLLAGTGDLLAAPTRRSELPLGGLQPVTAGVAQHLDQAVSFGLGSLGGGGVGGDQGLGVHRLTAQLLLGGAQQVEPPGGPPHRGRRGVVPELADLLDQPEPFGGVPDPGPRLTQRGQCADLPLGGHHPEPGALQLVEVLDHGVRGGEGVRLLEHHALVQLVDGGDLLTCLDTGEQIHRLRASTGGTDAEHRMDPGEELTVRGHRLQPGRTHGGVRQTAGRGVLQVGEVELPLDDAADLHRIIEDAGGGRDVPGAHRGEPLLLRTAGVDPGHGDGGPGVRPVAAQHTHPRAVLGTGLVDLAAAVGEDIALVLAPGTAGHRPVGRPVERRGVRHHQGDVGVHQRGLAGTGPTAQQCRRGREADAVRPVIAAPVHQLQVTGEPLLAAGP